MKANEAPEKIYVHKSQYWGLMANEHNITKDGIEYTRTDAFIEKAVDWWVGNFVYTDDVDVKYKAIKDFKNYMEGE